MRRADRAIDLNEAREILNIAPYGVLSLVSSDNTPYGIPLNFALEGDGIYFHSAKEGRKINLLAENQEASFCAVGNAEVLPEQFATNYESAIATGTVEELVAGEKRLGLLILLKKYSPEYINAGLEYTEKFLDKTRVFRMNVASITGKARQ
ncbi:MAG: pyridoxamine 5'-phosphate oxidase family protein [Candidatus Electrothrix scaldis]|nr:MAG: pyridoxamine 5'-phosphate oxidase family protein [Candidatus Electrothrix sp. GW3-3]